MTKNKNIANVEKAIQHCYSTWGERYYEDYYNSENTYPPVHTDIVRKILIDEEPRNLLDVGCGPASMLRDLLDMNINLYGFDLTPEMVAEGKNILEQNDINSSQIWQGSALDPTSYQNDATELTSYDAALCFGVLPHIPEEMDTPILENINRAIAPNGLIMIEARNELFSLFTMNRPTSEFISNKLINVSSLKEKNPDEIDKIDQATNMLNQGLRLDLPPVRKGYEDEPGYDEVLSRTHNPFELKAKAEAIGITDVEILFYHYHALPPLAAHLIPDTFRRESIAMENPRDWRGYFMASAFILTGRAS
ncbi:class I SAM-dependent methyltransferase [Kiloniella majae]|uniref:class I SAM-dependent methyltransferase n=1 Tax=Kiloniella majae TaxID=1938558 RepID=UPI000A277558|nr:class I SAM-dependent methyltransferase [Kiloniella majae]